MKTKISKILGVALALATIASLFAFATPVAAGTQTWTSYAIPATSTNWTTPGQVLNSTINAGGPIAEAIDGTASTAGTLYAYVNDPVATPSMMIVKSINGGRTWAVSGSVGQPPAPVIEIVCSPNEANVVFYITAAGLYMSLDSGVTFTLEVSVPVTDALTALDVAKWGTPSRYIAVVGVNALLGGATMTAGVYYWDQAQPFNNFVQVGTTAFTSVGGVATLMNVLSVRMAPTFATDRAVVAMGVDAVGPTVHVRTDVGGGAWGAVIGDFTFGTAAGANTTAGDIAMPSDYSALASPIYFVCAKDADAADGGVWRVIGATGTLIDAQVNANNLSINGTFTSGTATILEGQSGGTVRKSVNSGGSFSAVTLRSSCALTSWVLLDRNYSTSKLAWVLNVGLAQGALNVSTDSLSSINQWSLINTSIAFIRDLAVAPNGDLFMITTNTTAPTVYAAGTITTVVGSNTVTGVGTTFTAAMVGGTLVTAGANTYLVTGFTDATHLTISPTVTVAEAGVAYTLTYTGNTSLWRNLNSVGTPWERVLYAAGNSMNRLTLGVGSNSVIAYWQLGSNAPLNISSNSANSFSAMSSAPGSIVGYANNVSSLFIINSTTVVVGDATGTIVTNQTSTGASSTYWWTETPNAPFGAGYTVSDIRSAGGSNLLAVALTATGVEVAKSANNGLTWTLLTDPNQTTAVTSVLAITGGIVAYVAPAADYTTSGNIFITVTAATSGTPGVAGGGVWRYAVTVAGGAAAANMGWLRVDNGTGSTDTVTWGDGLVTAPGGPGSATEGSGMVYALDTSLANGDVGRIRGLSVAAEKLESTVPSAPAAFFGWTFAANNLQASTAASGNIQLWAVAALTPAIWTYTDTLGVAGTGVTVSNLVTAGGTSTCTLTWNNLPNATAYNVYVNTVKQNTLYTAVSAGATVSAVTVGTSTSTCNVTAMATGATYYVSIWANNGFTVGPPGSDSSFIYTGGSGTSFQTPLPVPVTPMNLVPAVGATNVPILPQFGWMQVTGATSYTLQIALATGTFSSPLYNNAAVPALSGPTVTFQYTGAALLNNTSYMWRVMANGAGPSDWVYGNFTTIPAVVPPVTVTNPPSITLTQAAAAPVPTIVITQQPAVTITQAAAPVVTITQQSPPNITLVPPTAATPAYIWVIVAVGAVLTLAVIILIVRTRRVV